MVVLGLSQDGDASTLRDSLAAAGLSLDGLQVMTPDDFDEDIVDEVGLAGEDLLLTDPGTQVPGINTMAERPRYFRSESMTDAIGDLGIPESELDNYAEALEGGKSIIAYVAKPDTIDKALEIFRSANLINVRQY